MTFKDNSVLVGVKRSFIWFTLLFAIVIYNVVGYVLTRGKLEKELSLALLSGFIVVSFTIFVLVIYLLSGRPKRIDSPNRKISKIELTSWAMIETIVILGLVLTLLSNVLSYVFWFSVPALFLVAVYAPRGTGNE